MNDTSCCLMLLGLTMDNTTGGGNNENSHYCHQRTSPCFGKAGFPGHYLSIAAPRQEAPLESLPTAKGEGGKGKHC